MKFVTRFDPLLVEMANSDNETATKQDEEFVNSKKREDYSCNADCRQ